MAVRSSFYGVGDSNMNTVFIQNQRLPYSSSSQPFDSLFTSGSSDSPSFLGSGSQSMFSFRDINVRKRSERPFFCAFDQEDINVDEDSDEYFHQPEKKKRLKVDQIQFLEKSFEEDNKLEPERKIQLAKDLGLQPRQIAIWFQNRRARWKTKRIEKDYDVLQAHYNNLKADYDNLVKEKEKLKAEVHCLTSRLLLDDGNNEEINLVKIDVLDESSPRGDGVRLLEPVDSSYVYQSDASQDEDNCNRSVLPSAVYAFENLEDGVYSDPRANSCQFGFLDDDDDDAFGF